MKKVRVQGRARQTGVSLVELLVGLALSLIVTTAMVILMGNSMGTATRIIEMSQLTDELRNSMSMISRDLRRANYNANALYCFSNSDCGDVGDASALQAGNVGISTDSDGDTCLEFGLDRDWDGDSTNDGGGAFRRFTEDGVARIEIWVSPDTAPVCGLDGDTIDGEIVWVPITDPDLVNITQFDVENSAATGSYFEDLAEEDGSTLRQQIRFVQIRIGGELVLDSGMSRAVVDTVKVRNDLFENI